MKKKSLSVTLSVTERIARGFGLMGASTKKRPRPRGINKSQTPYGSSPELSTVSEHRVELP